MTNLKELIAKPKTVIDDYLLNVEIEAFIKDVEALILVELKPKEQSLSDDFDTLTKLGDIE
jgi:hypothetical protein